MPPRREALLAAALLGLAGCLLLAGGALHPRVPPQPADQVRAIASSRLWAPAHWLLTAGQALAIPAAALAFRQATIRRPLAVAAAAALGLGLGLGTLGTLLAATGLRAAARQGDPQAFAATAQFDLGLGWLCLLLCCAGVSVLGLLHHATRAAPARWLGRAAAAVSLPLLAAAALIPYDHWLTHQVVLRAGALALGTGLLAAAAAWPGALRAVRPDPPGPTEERHA